MKFIVGDCTIQICPVRVIFFPTLVPGSSGQRHFSTNSFAGLQLSITVWVRVRICVRVIVRVRVSVTVMVRVSNVLGSG